MIDIKKFGFDRKELEDIAISTSLLAFIFFYDGYRQIFNLGQDTLYGYLIYLAIVALAFIPHEMAHKFTAIKYGCAAKYQIWWKGLKLAFLLAIITDGRFVIAAPGAVIIYSMQKDMFGRVSSRISNKENAYISIAGPAANLIVAVIMLFISGILSIGGFDLAGNIGYVSCFLAVFNLLPIPPLDGSKIFSWNRGIWLGLMIAGFILMGMF